MFKKNNIRETLGLTQEELAILLQVSRSQLSLYEIGKRKLPQAATLLLANLLTNAQAKNKAKLNEKQIFAENEVAYLNELLVKNEYKLTIITKKIEKTKQQQQLKLGASNLIAFFEKENATKKANPILKSIRKKAENKNNMQKQLIQLQIKKEVLQFENKTIKKYIKIF
jgi:transcriptional regulator with XRE-family HTH domain